MDINRISLTVRPVAQSRSDSAVSLTSITPFGEIHCLQ